MEISIIMSVYNETDLLKRSITSVMNQTFSDWELIIIDDGSKDEVLQICHSFAEKDARVRFYRQKHAGLATARNYGIRFMRGQYVAFLDADDYMHPQMLEWLYQAIVSTGTLIAACGFRRVKQIPPISEMTEFQKHRFQTVLIAGDSKDKKDTKLKDNVYAWNKLYHKSLFEQIKFPDGRFHEDLAIMHKLFARAEKITICKEVLYYYYQNPHGIINTINEDKVFDCLWAYRQRIRFYVKAGYETDLNHVTHTFLYKAYELYNKIGLHKTKQSRRIREVRSEIRRIVRHTFLTYDLIRFLPVHGKIRYWVFLFCPPLFEADLYCRRNLHLIMR